MCMTIFILLEYIPLHNGQFLILCQPKDLIRVSDSWDCIALFNRKTFFHSDKTIQIASFNKAAVLHTSPTLLSLTMGCIPAVISSMRTTLFLFKCFILTQQMHPVKNRNQTASSIVRMNDWKHIELLYFCCRLRLAVKFTEARVRTRRVTRWLRRMWTMTQAVAHAPTKERVSTQSTIVTERLCLPQEREDTQCSGWGWKTPSHGHGRYLSSCPPPILTTHCPSLIVPTPHSAPRVYYMSITQLLHVYYTASHC